MSTDAQRPRPDFINLQLSPAGLAFAGEGATLRIATGRMHYLFVGPQSVEVLRGAEWPYLQRQCDAAGKPLLQVVPDASVAVAPAPVPVAAAQTPAATTTQAPAPATAAAAQ